MQGPSHAALVIPAFNAAATLEPLLAALGGLGIWGALPLADRLLVVDDGSRDGTAGLLEKAGVRFLRVPENRGKGHALHLGLRWARENGFAWALTLDADLQHRPEDVGAFLAFEPDATTGLVVGQRTRSGSSMPWHRRFSNAVTTRHLARLAQRAVQDSQSGFRLYRTEWLAHPAIPRDGRFEWESRVLVLAARLGYGIESRPVATVYGEAGSHIRLLRDTWRFVRLVREMQWN